MCVVNVASVLLFFFFLYFTFAWHCHWRQAFSVESNALRQQHPHGYNSNSMLWAIQADTPNLLQRYWCTKKGLASADHSVSAIPWAHCPLVCSFPSAQENGLKVEAETTSCLVCGNRKDCVHVCVKKKRSINLNAKWVTQSGMYIYIYVLGSRTPLHSENK